MGSLRSWVGAICSLVVFLVARRFSTGLAAPVFASAVLSCVYIWFFVLRVSEMPVAQPEPVDAGASAEASSDGTPSVAAAAVRKQDESGKAEVKPGNVEEEQGAEKEDGKHVKEDAEDEEKEDAADNCEPALEERKEEKFDETEGQDAIRASARQPEKKVAPFDSTTHWPHDPDPPAEASAAGAGAGARGEVEAADDQCDRPTTRDGATDEECDRRPPAAGARGGNSDSESEDEEARLLREENEFADPERAKELKASGNEAFKAGKLHDARECYSEALYLTPVADKKDKAVLYCNRAACQQKLERWDEVVSDCKLAIELDAEYIKAYCRRSTANEALNKWHDALEDLKKAIELDPSLRSKEYRRQAVLESRATAQFEKDKDEMMGKLKDLGNTVLGKFGMSMDNFKMEQDPDTGSYSIKYGNQ